MLDEQQTPTGSEHPTHVAERSQGVGDAAQRPSRHDRVDARVLKRNSLGRALDEFYRPVAGAHSARPARYYTPSGHSIQATGITPDIEVLQDVPDNMKAQTDIKGEASLRGHLKAEGAEQTGSQSYVPPDESDDKAIKMALDLLRGTATNAAFPPNSKAAVHN